MGRDIRLCRSRQTYFIIHISSKLRPNERKAREKRDKVEVMAARPSKSHHHHPKIIKRPPHTIISPKIIRTDVLRRSTSPEQSPRKYLGTRNDIAGHKTYTFSLVWHETKVTSSIHEVIYSLLFSYRIIATIIACIERLIL